MVKVVISDCGPFTGEVSVRPYLNGILLSDQEQKVDSSCAYVNVLTRGSGLAMLAVIVNDKAVKNYDNVHKMGSQSTLCSCEKGKKEFRYLQAPINYV